MKLATLCYVQQQGKTLMLHRIKKSEDIHEGKWNGLGGKFEAGETPEECVIREVEEESGLRIQSPQLRGFLSFPLFANNEDWYSFVFTATQFTGSLKQSYEGELHWIDNSELLNLRLWPGDRIFIPWLEYNEFFSGKFCYENGELVEHSVTFHRFSD